MSSESAVTPTSGSSTSGGSTSGSPTSGSPTSGIPTSGIPTAGDAPAHPESAPLGNAATATTPNFAFAEYRDVLLANSTVYEAMVRRTLDAYRTGNSELTLQRIEAAASFAGRHHPGRFSDGTIENVAMAIGRTLQPPANASTMSGRTMVGAGDRRRVLHVATRVYAIGGHTRMLRHWAENDANSVHSLVLLNQADEPMPGWLINAFASSGGAVYEPPQHATLLQRALHLRSIAHQQSDLVVLHHHPHDVVPTVAFATDGGPPVALLNHADHLFWLGSSVADLVIDLRSAATAISKTRRHARRSAVLPIPLAEHAAPWSRPAARAILGIPLDQLMLVSVGRPEKYRPCGPFSFVAAATEVLDRCPDAHLYIVGASGDNLRSYVDGAARAALHLAGSVEDPAQYFAAADIYVESFPFGSNTALLEAAASELPVVAAPAPIFPLLVGGNDSLADVLSNPANVGEFVDRVERLVVDPGARTEQGRALAERVAMHHVGQGWQRHLRAAYESAHGLVHAPKAIPAAGCMESTGDVALTLRAYFSAQSHPLPRPGTEATETAHAMPAGEERARVSSRQRRDLASSIARYRVQVAREAREFAVARRYAASGVSGEPFSAAAWRMLAVATLGRSAEFVRDLRRLK